MTEPPPEVAEYVREHAPELEPREVSSFMDEHAKPDGEPDSHVQWAVRILRERRAGEATDGLSVDRVVSELRRHDRSTS